jgi:Na+-driven multidrug efflux pump
MVKDIFAIALPSIVMMFSNMFVEVINLSFIGHGGNAALVAGLGIGNMYLNCFGLSVSIGLNTAVTTLVS